MKYILIFYNYLKNITLNIINSLKVHMKFLSFPYIKNKMDTVNFLRRELKGIPILLIFTLIPVHAQQACFLNNWNPKNIQTPEYEEVIKPVDPVTVSLIIHATDTVTKIPLYIFGDNANAYTGSMSENRKLMKYLADRNMGVLRGPSGSISDVYFWNRSEYNRPEDVPETLLSGGSDNNWPWYGKRPNSWDAGWAMDIDSFYSILEQANVTGLLTVNYGYARYGTSQDPVAQAAHMAADWVRYDNGRTKFWEIGNEVFGGWEAGYRIDTLLNKDGQPEYINGTLYGQHCRVFIDSMKKAATETGAEIYIGAVVAESTGSNSNNWNEKVMAEVGDIIDFYIIHSYYTPWEQDSKADTILNSPFKTKGYISFLNSFAVKTGTPMHPVALTEYNIFSVGSKQMVSQINGMHAVLVTGEVIKNKLGAACRWDLANGYSNGNDHGMYSYGNEPGAEKYAPRPAFYYLYYMQKYLGDNLLNTSVTGSNDIVAYSSSFSSGQISTILVNRGLKNRVVRINFENSTVGNRYYTYTLTGGDDISSDPWKPFSRKVIVNDIGPSGVAGGPVDYNTIKAKSFDTGEEILVEAPPFSVLYVLADTGRVQLPINNKLTPTITWSDPADIVYGTLLTALQLNAKADVAGKFYYNPLIMTKLDVGSGTELIATFIPTDTMTYAVATKTVKINVLKAIPVISWDTPSDITYGTLLSETQLNATSFVKGTFTYDPSPGTLLPAGDGQELHVLFSPDDSSNYNSAIKTITINVIDISSVNNSLASGLRIFPLPVTDVLRIDHTVLSGQKQKVMICIQNIDGRMIHSQVTVFDGNPIEVYIKNLPSGLYVLNLKTKIMNLTERFVKL